jgi:hypothetical protein
VICNSSSFAVQYLMKYLVFFFNVDNVQPIENIDRPLCGTSCVAAPAVAVARTTCPGAFFWARI